MHQEEEEEEDVEEGSISGRDTPEGREGFDHKMSPSSTVPVVQVRLGGDDPVLAKLTMESRKMVEMVSSAFESRFGSKPSFLTKVPGRVNLIGDHIDYCGFPVLPMALDQGMWFAVSYETRTNKSGPTLLTAINVNGQKYPEFECVLDGDIFVDSSGHPTWRDYFLSGIKGTLNHLSSVLKERLGLVSKINVVVHGNVIPSSGLSSSSALVSGSVTVLNHLLDLLASDGDRGVRMDKTRLAQLSANSERLIGTESGGMDQAIAFLAEESTAKYIEFEPNLRGTGINIPKNITFFISHSNATCNKGSDDQYNSRVLDTRIGSALIYHHWVSTGYLAQNLLAASQELRSKKGFLQLSDALRLHVQAKNLIGANVRDTDHSVFQDMIDLTHQLTDRYKDNYTISDILKELSIDSVDQLLSLIAGKCPDSWVRLKELISNRNKFKIRSRVEHVFLESSLVELFREVCSESGPDGDQSVRLGDILNSSQDTMRDKCESSIPLVDQLIQTSRQCGSLGARISGAGFGGCIVALVPVSGKDEYKTQLKLKRPDDHFTFESLPSAGVTVFQVTD